MPEIRNYLKDYLKKKLAEDGYDGLFNNDGKCGCDLEDLIPCGEPSEYCQPGYKGPCDCEEGCRFHVGPNPPEDKNVQKSETTENPE